MGIIFIFGSKLHFEKAQSSRKVLIISSYYCRPDCWLIWQKRQQYYEMVSKIGDGLSSQGMVFTGCVGSYCSNNFCLRIPVIIA
jgi:hypothetical protein